jgi:hypothetical protein
LSGVVLVNEIYFPQLFSDSDFRDEPVQVPYGQEFSSLGPDEGRSDRIVEGLVYRRL